MADPKLERLGAATGVGFVSLILAGYFSVPQPAPTPSDPVADIATYLAANRTGLLAQEFLFALGGALFLWFLVSVWSYLRRAEGTPARLSVVAFGGGVATILLAFLAGALANAGHLHFSATATETTLFYLANGVFQYTSFTAGVFLLASGLVILRTGALDQWVGYAGAFLGTAAIVGGLGTFMDSGSLAQGEVYQQVLFFAFLLWVFVVSVLLAQRATAAPARKTAARRKR